MVLLEGCPRCSGYLLVEEDLGLDLEDLVCLQCGHRQEIEVVRVVPNTVDLIRARWHISQEPSTSSARALWSEIASGRGRGE